MPYTPPSAGEILVELAGTTTYTPPSAYALNVELAASESASGVTSYVTSTAGRAVTAYSLRPSLLSHTIPSAGLEITAYEPSYATTLESIIDLASALVITANAVTYAATTEVEAGGLTITALQPTYFSGFINYLGVVGAISVAPQPALSFTIDQNPAPSGALAIAGLVPSFSTTTDIDAVGSLYIKGKAIAGAIFRIHKEVVSAYSMPDITLDVSGSLEVAGYDVTSLYKIAAGFDIPCVLTTPVAASVEAVYHARIANAIVSTYALRAVIAAGKDSFYAIKNTQPVAKGVDCPYRFPLTKAIVSPYSLTQNTEVRKTVVSTYALKQSQTVQASVDAPYNLIVNSVVRVGVVAAYSSTEFVRTSIVSSYALTQPVAKEVQSPYALDPVTMARVGVEGVYSLLDSQVIAITVPPYVSYAGRVLPIEEAEVSIAEGEYAWTCTVILTNVSDYVLLKQDQPFTVVIGSESYAFIVDSKELDRGAPANYGIKLLGISPSASKTTPRKVAANYVWETAKQASEIAEELLPGIDWQVIDWGIPAYRLAMESSTPIEVVRTLADAIGATLETEIDGSLYVRSLFPVSVPSYDSRTPAHVFLESIDILNVNESYVAAEVFNRLVITDVEQSISDSLEWIEDYQDATTGIIRAFLYPWRSPVSLLHTGVPSVTIGAGSTVLEQHSEIIEVFKGQGETAYPIHHVESIQYEAQNVGALVYDIDSRSFTVGGPSFNSVIRVVYWTRSLDYRVSLPEARPTQFLLESAPL